jgi:hypothetical protein
MSLIKEWQIEVFNFSQLHHEWFSVEGELFGHGTKN